MEYAVLVLVLILAFANGANDVPKGVATLAGCGVTKVRTALIWGTATTIAGCLLSLQFAGKMTALFSKGVVSADPTPAFAASVLIGTVAWVVLATVLKLPVSTTHALVGALLGAGALFASSAVQWTSLLTKVVQPLLVSILVAFAVSAVLARIAGAIATRAAARTSVPEREDALIGARDSRVGPEAGDPAESGSRGGRGISAAHWLTSGLTGMARGMNDTPKIVAIGSFAMVSGMTTNVLAVCVTIAMGVGGLLVGSRIVDRLGRDVVKMNHVEGFTANLTTAVLVGAGASQGLPMATTHVSASAIAASAGGDLSRLKGKTLRDFALAWIVTPPFAAAVAAGAYLVLA
ncbi:inorganic phosphate transporter [Streptomyces anulatus]|uniref:inorganic phosphate transporter n=1 Tax=Streptomyces anulatus TaxID=1892 RepID=UPI00368BADE4